MKNENIKTPLTAGRIICLAALVLLALVAKVMPYAIYRMGWQLDPTDIGSYIWNFSPLMPLAIVAGASLPRNLAIALPLGTWFAGDLLIGIVSGHMEWAFYAHQPLVYGLVIGLVALGLIGKKYIQSETFSERTLVNVSSGLIGATLFFLVSNSLIWALGDEMNYSKTLGGLVECFMMAVPFYRASLVSMVVFVPIFTAILTPGRELEMQKEAELSRQLADS